MERKDLCQEVFDVQAVNRFFTEVANVKEFARQMRHYVYQNSILWLQNSDEIAQEVSDQTHLLNEFLEVIDPYYEFKPKNQ